MSIVDVFFISLGLSMDNMAVAAAGGCSGKKCGLGYIAKVALIFCMVGLLFLAAGFVGGREAQGLIEGWDHWFSFILLCYIGAKIVKESFAPQQGTTVCLAYDMSNSKTLFLMALTTNIDVFAVGVSLGFYNINLPLVMGILAFCIASATGFGFAIGNKLGKLFGKRVEFFGGAVLIILGFKILIEGLTH